MMAILGHVDEHTRRNLNSFVASCSKWPICVRIVAVYQVQTNPVGLPCPGMGQVSSLTSSKTTSIGLCSN
jgi:hypothetical protein